MTDTPTARRSTRDVLLDAPDLDAERERAKRGSPWCDTCQRPSVGNYGLQHTSAEHPFGIPHEWDDSGHEVTHQQWHETPSSRTDEEIAEAKAATLASRVPAVDPDVVATALGVELATHSLDVYGDVTVNGILEKLTEHGLKVVRA